MLPRLLALCFCVFASGCLREAVKQTDAQNSRTVWRASEDNGDKPGFGIELTQESGRVNGKFFLLDPNKPHDFKAGRAFPTEIVQSGESELRFIVRLDDQRKDEFVVRLQDRLKGDRVNATLRDLKEGTQPIPLTFVRQK